MLRKILQFASNATGGNLSPYLAWNHVYGPQLQIELDGLRNSPRHEIFYVLENKHYYNGSKVKNQIDDLSFRVGSAVPERNIDHKIKEIEYGSYIKFNRSTVNRKLQIFIIPEKLDMQYLLPADRQVIPLSKKAHAEKIDRKINVENHADFFYYVSKIFCPSFKCADAQKILPLFCENSWAKFFQSYQNRVPPASPENLAAAYKFLVYGGETKVTDTTLFCE